ncbi:hypothetical protein DFR58_10178 [Anaerobacterium chartisolvens]|uniref:Phage protein D n=1 Tax=Anaerobacterium chartisolvens TaxID=1297424 RepID=A0A369BJY5_9FIRM|nr:hypothetical protein [Anaerobacterium chartisolvens]RCX20876.1 hypothetical protein DFR58_10178 [Anaerobacterium chartisolvens]
MRVIYEGRDITGAVQIRKADITDNAGGIADSLELKLADTEGLWSKWKPQKGNKIEVIEKGFSSGQMFIDYIQQDRGGMRMKALPIPLNAKSSNTKAWESVRFLELASEISGKYGFELEVYGLENWLYERVDQIDRTDFEFLAWRCVLEGYALKLCGQKVVIYSQKQYEAKEPTRTVNLEKFDGDFDFSSVSIGLYSSCNITYAAQTGPISYTFKPSAASVGSVLKPKMYVNNQAEAERFAKNLLRAENKKEHTGRIQMELDTGLAAGCNINIAGIGLADGKYFVEQATHMLASEKTILKLRRPLEGY